MTVIIVTTIFGTVMAIGLIMGISSIIKEELIYFIRKEIIDYLEEKK